MGVTNLWSILEPVKQHKNLTSLKGQTVAVDLSVWVCETQCVKQMQGIVSKPYLRNLFFRISYLMQLGVNLVFVIDGEAPELKWEAMWKRQQVRYPGKNSNAEQTSRRGAYGKQKRSHFKSSLKECCELLDHLGVVYIQSRGEAEALCALLNSKGLVDGVITEDGDAFLYGARKVYRNFTMNSKDPHVESYCMDEVEDSLHLNQEKLVSLALLMGCDYLPKGVPGVGITLAAKLMSVLQEFSVLERMKMWKTMPNDACIDSTEKKVKKKASTVDGFPSLKVIDEFLTPKDKCPKHFPNGRRPLVQRIQLFALSKLEWPETYTLEKVLPLVTLWDMTVIKQNGRNIASPYLQPQRIVKARVRQGVPCFEINWNTNGVVAIHNVDCFTTIEEQELFSKCFPETVEEFEHEVAAKKTKPKRVRKTKDKQEKTDKEADVHLDNPSTAEVHSTEHSDEVDMLTDSILNMSMKDLATPMVSTKCLAAKSQSSASTKIHIGHEINAACDLAKIKKKQTISDSYVDKFIHVDQTNDMSEDTNEYLPLAARLRKRLGASRLDKYENKTSRNLIQTPPSSNAESSVPLNVIGCKLLLSQSENAYSCTALKDRKTNSSIKNSDGALLMNSDQCKSGCGIDNNEANKRYVLPAERTEFTRKISNPVKTISADISYDREVVSIKETVSPASSNLYEAHTNIPFIHNSRTTRVKPIKECKDGTRRKLSTKQIALDDKSSPDEKEQLDKNSKNSPEHLPKSIPGSRCDKFSESNLNLLKLSSVTFEEKNLQKSDEISKLNPNKNAYQTEENLERDKVADKGVTSSSCCRDICSDIVYKGTHQIGDNCPEFGDHKEEKITCLSVSNVPECSNADILLKMATTPNNLKEIGKIHGSSPESNHLTPLCDNFCSVNQQIRSTLDSRQGFKYSSPQYLNINSANMFLTQKSPSQFLESPIALDLSKNLTFNLSACSSYEEQAEKFNVTVLDKSSHLTCGNFAVESSLLNSFYLCNSILQTPKSCKLLKDGSSDRNDCDAVTVRCDKESEKNEDDKMQGIYQGNMVQSIEKTNGDKMQGIYQGNIVQSIKKTNDDKIEGIYQGNIVNSVEINHCKESFIQTCVGSTNQESICENNSTCDTIKRSVPEVEIHGVRDTNAHCETESQEKDFDLHSLCVHQDISTPSRSIAQTNDVESQHSIELNNPISVKNSFGKEETSEFLEGNMKGCTDTDGSKLHFSARKTGTPETFNVCMEHNNAGELENKMNEKRSECELIKHNKKTLLSERDIKKEGCCYENESLLNQNKYNLNQECSGKQEILDDSVIDEMLSSLQTRLFTKVPPACKKDKHIKKESEHKFSNKENFCDSKQSKKTARKKSERKSKHSETNTQPKDYLSRNISVENVTQCTKNKKNYLTLKSVDNPVQEICLKNTEDHTSSNSVCPIFNSQFSNHDGFNEIVEQCDPLAQSSKICDGVASNLTIQDPSKVCCEKPVLDSNDKLKKGSFVCSSHSIKSKKLNVVGECKNSPVSLADRLKARLQGDARTALCDISKLRNNSGP